VANGSLRTVDRPAGIRWGDADVIAPPAETALRFLELTPGAQGQSLGPTVEHKHLFPGNVAGAAVRERAVADAIAFFSRLTASD
jgi:hypothetical protein